MCLGANMKKAHEYTPKQHLTNNFGNNFITLESMLSADFKKQSNEHFEKCLKLVPVISSLLISKDKCDNEKHYQEVKAVADLCLSMAMIERRLGIVDK